MEPLSYFTAGLSRVIKSFASFKRLVEIAQACKDFIVCRAELFELPHGDGVLS